LKYPKHISMTEDKHPPEDGDQIENARLIAQFAHDDIWWYRSNQWNAVNGALVLIAAVVGLTRMFVSEADLTFSKTWYFSLLACVVAVGSCWYLAHLHSETIETRRLMRKASKLCGAEQLRVRIWQRTYEHTDHSRGVFLILMMDLAISVAFGATVAYLTRVYWSGAIAGVVACLIGSLRLCHVVRANLRKSDA